MAMMTNDPSGGFQGIPGQPQSGVGGAALPPGSMGAPQPPPYIPRSLSLKEYVQMARAQKMVPRFTNVAGQGGDMSGAWMGPDGQGRGNAFVQPDEYKMGPGGAPQKAGAIPSPGQRPANRGPQKQIGQMTPDELRNVDIYQLALDKTRGQIPALFKHVFGQHAQTPKDLNAEQMKHWQKQVQALNNHNLKGLDKQMERNVKMFQSKNLLQDEEGKAAADERKNAESDYKSWEAAKNKDPLNNTQTFEQYRAAKRAAIDKVAPKPKKKQPAPVMSGEETGIPSVGPEPIPGWGPGAVPEKGGSEPSQQAVMDAAQRAYKASGGDKKVFAEKFQQEMAGTPPTSPGPTGGGSGKAGMIPAIRQAAIPDENTEEEQYQEE